MEADDRYKLENMLLRSYLHFRYFKLKARFKATKDLHFEGLPKHYSNNSMTRMQGSRYLMHVYNCHTEGLESYCCDVGTLTAERLEVNNRFGSRSCFVDGQYMLVVRYNNPMTIFRGLIEIGQIKFNAKYEFCKNDHFLYGRYAQHIGHSVYAMENGASLYRIEWQDIKDGKYVKTLVKEDVNSFYVDRRLGLATLNTSNSLTLPNGTVVDLKAKVDSKATWTLVTCIAEYWIACGDRDLDIDSHAILASVDKQGRVRSKLTLKLTSNGYKKRDGVMFAGIFSLQNVFITGRRGIMLAIERDGCCHLISVTYGRMSKLQSIASIDVAGSYERNRIVLSVTTTGTKGEFIAGGENWTRRIRLKLK